ncbi:metal-dependent transcriptional regulator [Oceanispirochaeta sp.]|jgi:DtxR family Mn-dependent transcriptional regulator|uniref:metal-dependent transcriptional regulator n=1 Tax=Oceanispirochaeta sp. TaxID=2035350 RepID=UPI00260CA9F5|nr:metal-dependent transcriptional regulator [Oceanispirochaeta sp.]MDA3957008.1 metal-dependent transcriptional regulator [Oceanispirochaeta sp.]
MEKNVKLTPSLEDYLEAILQLEKINRVARVKDIAEKLSVQMPSVTGALKNLKSKGMIEYEKNSFINLTARGKELAEIVLKKHNILVTFLEETLLLDTGKAEDEACRIEHSIDLDTAKRIKNLSSYLRESFKEKAADLEKIILG